jgi:hypothetical protein
MGGKEMTGQWPWFFGVFDANPAYFSFDPFRFVQYFPQTLADAAKAE